jgi:hypothetical protein
MTLAGMSSQLVIAATKINYQCALKAPGKGRRSDNMFLSVHVSHINEWDFILMEANIGQRIRRKKIRLYYGIGRLQ